MVHARVIPTGAGFVPAIRDHVYATMRAIATAILIAAGMLAACSGSAICAMDRECQRAVAAWRADGGWEPVAYTRLDCEVPGVVRCAKLTGPDGAEVRAHVLADGSVALGVVGR